MNRINLMEGKSSIRIWSIIKCPPLMMYPMNLNRSLSKTLTDRALMVPKDWARAESFRWRLRWRMPSRGAPERGSKSCHSRRSGSGAHCNRRKSRDEGVNNSGVIPRKLAIASGIQKFQRLDTRFRGYDEPALTY